MLETKRERTTHSQQPTRSPLEYQECAEAVPIVLASTLFLSSAPVDTHVRRVLYCSRLYGAHTVVPAIFAFIWMLFCCLTPPRLRSIPLPPHLLRCARHPRAQEERHCTVDTIAHDSLSSLSLSLSLSSWLSQSR